jgi:hypothetical protein
MGFLFLMVAYLMIYGHESCPPQAEVNFELSALTFEQVRQRRSGHWG